MANIRVILADDHGVLRKGVRFLLAGDPGIEVVGEAEDGRQAVKLAEQLHPDVVIMDIAMPNLNGIEATARITRNDKHVGVIILSMYSDEEYVLRALAAGAKGYLLKDSAEPDLLRAVRSVARQRPFFSPAIVTSMLEDYVHRVQRDAAQDSLDLLTDREKEVLQLLAEGKTNKEVASILHLGVSTVETHRNNLMQKLNLHNTAELVVYAVKKKILKI
jgi:two-component system, NarL family, response regulator NreC